MAKMHLGTNVAQYVGGAQLARDLADAGPLNMRRVRLDCPPVYNWPSSRGFDFSFTDRNVNAALAAGLVPHLMFSHWLPLWKTGAKDSKCQVSDFTSIGQFASAGFARYNGKARSVEAGNENNSRDFCGGQQPDPKFYAQFLKTLIAALPSTRTFQFWTGGTAPVAGSGYVLQSDWYREFWPLLSDAEKAQIDAVALHIYHDPSGDTKGMACVAPVHELTGKPVVITEHNGAYGDDPQQYAHDLADGLAALSGLGYVKWDFIFSMSQTSGQPGMYTASGAATPELQVVKQYQGVA